MWLLKCLKIFRFFLIYERSSSVVISAFKTTSGSDSLIICELFVLSLMLFGVLWMVVMILSLCVMLWDV